MRKLKFRVWSEDQKTYDYKFPYNSIGDFYVSTHGVVYSDFGNTIAPEVRQKAFIIEQYTGLKDKNGKEIYEGDIVRTKSPDQPNFSAGAIEMVQEMYLIMNSAHYSDPELSHCEPLGYYCDTELEVIGNIHENPELCGEEEE